jgi:DNA repair exonuclease SbcCD ATPase subunit
MQETADEKAALLAQFMVETEAAFRNRAEEKQELQRELEEKTAELRSHLAGATLAGLQADLESAFEARVKNQMTSEDRERCAGQPSYPAAELRGWCDQKRGEIQQAREGIALREAKRPRDAERALHQRNLEALQRKAREAAAAFAQVDEQHREPTPLIADEIRAALKRERQEQTRLTNVLVEAERTVANLQGQLKQAQPHRALDAIQTDLEEAQEAYNREETLQQARALLKERIADKMATLAAHVPAELSKRVTEHLARLTTRAAGEVVLNSDLAVAHWSSHGSGTVWQPGQLSYGERHQAALAVKIAVARALAETAGPVFIILDDSLVTFDPQRRSAAEEFLLDLVSDEKLQVILLTCHTDWAADWHRRRPQQVTYHDLAHRVRYYEQPDVAKLQGIP